jgi:hypothetical protein
VLITNVVHGVVNYAKEQSYVRGDTNALYVNGQLNYSAVPPFQHPPLYRTWKLCQDHVAETWFYRFDSTADGRKEKYRIWNTVPQDHFYFKWLGYYTGSETTFRSIAEDVNHTGVSSQMEVYQATSEIPFDYEDPWRVIQDKSNMLQYNGDDSTQHLTPYYPWDDTTTLGVFLDREWTHEDWPYYSILPWKYLHYNSGANTWTKKDTLPLDEGDGIYLGQIVSGAGMYIQPANSVDSRDVILQNVPYRKQDLIYRQDSSETILRYKAHLMSDNEAQPTRYCNQRRIDIDPRGVYHMVYESAGHIWYTQSIDSGAHWLPEELVSAFAGGNTRPNHGAVNPCIAVYDSTVYVTYLSGHDIYLQCRYQGQWWHPTSYGVINSIEVETNATPVVDAGAGCRDLDPLPNEVVLVVWDNTDELRYSAFNIRYGALVRNFQTVDALYQGSSLAQPTSPSLISISDEADFGLAWREDGTILYNRAYLWNCNQWFQNIGLAEVASNAGDSCIFAPSLTHDQNANPVLAYEAASSQFLYSLRWINVRTRSIQSWNTTDNTIPQTSWFTQYGEPFNPSIGAQPTTYVCGMGSIPLGLRVAYNQNWGGGVSVIQLDCPPASWEDQVSGASYASLIAYAPTGLLRQVHSTQYQSPFSYVVRNSNQHLQKTSAIPLAALRDVYIHEENRTAVLGVYNPRIIATTGREQLLVWDYVDDTLVIGRNTTLPEKMKTEPFEVLPGMTYTFDRVLFSRNPSLFSDNLHFRIELRDAATNTLLIEHPIQFRSLPQDSSRWTTFALNLNPLSGRRVYASVGITGTFHDSCVAVRNVYLEESTLAKLISGESSTASTPKDYKLSQNHPNPFNPSTVIAYSLPEAGDVSIIVTNVFGQKVRTLVEQYRQAGTYGVTFDGSELPSGVYNYTMTINGNTISKRMTLMK